MFDTAFIRVWYCFFIDKIKRRKCNLLRHCIRSWTRFLRYYFKLGNEQKIEAEKGRKREKSEASTKEIIGRGVFRILSNIYDKTFNENSEQLKRVNYFLRKFIINTQKGLKYVPACHTLCKYRWDCLVCPRKRTSESLLVASWLVRLDHCNTIWSEDTIYRNADSLTAKTMRDAFDGVHLR